MHTCIEFEFSSLFTIADWFGALHQGREAGNSKEGCEFQDLTKPVFERKNLYFTLHTEQKRYAKSKDFRNKLVTHN